MEEGQIATDLLVSHLKSFTDFHLNIFDKWIDYLTNWARVDDFSTHVLGPLFIKYPKELRRVFLWTRSKNRWRRRTAPVSLVVPIRKYALFIDEGFEVANHLVLDHDDLIQKGTGWMLREIMGKREKKALKFLKQNKDKVTGTLLSYACEKLPKEKRVYKRSRS